MYGSALCCRSAPAIAVMASSSIMRWSIFPSTPARGVAGSGRKRGWGGQVERALPAPLRRSLALLTYIKTRRRTVGKLHDMRFSRDCKLFDARQEVERPQHPEVVAFAARILHRAQSVGLHNGVWREEVRQQLLKAMARLELGLGQRGIRIHLVRAHVADNEQRRLLQRRVLRLQ